jgi:hypothetical protein
MSKWDDVINTIGSGARRGRLEEQSVELCIPLQGVFCLVFGVMILNQFCKAIRRLLTRGPKASSKI